MHCRNLFLRVKSEKCRFWLLNLKSIIYNIHTFTMYLSLFPVFLLHIFKMYFLYKYLYSSNAQIAILATRASKGNGVDKDPSFMEHIFQ